MTIIGALGDTEEMKCDADFENFNSDISCNVYSEVNIGMFKCVRWRTAGTDGWNMARVSNY